MTLDLAKKQQDDLANEYYPMEHEWKLIEQLHRMKESNREFKNTLSINVLNGEEGKAQQTAFTEYIQGLNYKTNAFYKVYCKLGSQCLKLPYQLQNLLQFSIDSRIDRVRQQFQTFKADNPTIAPNYQTQGIPTQQQGWNTFAKQKMENQYPAQQINYQSYSQFDQAQSQLIDNQFSNQQFKLNQDSKLEEKIQRKITSNIELQEKKVISESMHQQSEVNSSQDDQEEKSEVTFQSSYRCTYCRIFFSLQRLATKHLQQCQNSALIIVIDKSWVQNVLLPKCLDKPSQNESRLVCALCGTIFEKYEAMKNHLKKQHVIQDKKDFSLYIRWIDLEELDAINIEPNYIEKPIHRQKTTIQNQQQVKKQNNQTKKKNK